MHPFVFLSPNTYTFSDTQHHFSVSRCQMWTFFTFGENTFFGVGSVACDVAELYSFVRVSLSNFISLENVMTTFGSCVLLTLPYISSNCYYYYHHRHFLFWLRIHNDIIIVIIGIGFDFKFNLCRQQCNTQRTAYAIIAWSTEKVKGLRGCSTIQLGQFEIWFEIKPFQITFSMPLKMIYIVMWRMYFARFEFHTYGHISSIIPTMSLLTLGTEVTRASYATGGEGALNL